MHERKKEKEKRRKKTGKKKGKEKKEKGKKEERKERLNSFAIVHMCKDISINTDAIITEFSKESRRLQFIVD